MKPEDEHIKCIRCIHARVDKHASTKKWKAYECGNPDSEFYRCLLNVTESGITQSRITWTGCKKAKLKVRAV